MDLSKIVDEVFSGGFDYLFIGPHEGDKIIVQMDCRMKSGVVKEEILNEKFLPKHEKKVFDELERLLNKGRIGNQRWDIRYAYSGPKFVGIRCFGPQRDLFDPQRGFVLPSSGVSGGGSGNSNQSNCTPSDCGSCTSCPSKKKKR